MNRVTVVLFENMFVYIWNLCIKYIFKFDVNLYRWNMSLNCMYIYGQYTHIWRCVCMCTCICSMCLINFFIRIRSWLDQTPYFLNSIAVSEQALGECRGLRARKKEKEKRLGDIQPARRSSVGRLASVHM